MGDKSGISWTDATWNPVVGCTKVSEGCRNCYASTLHNQRYRANWQAALRRAMSPGGALQVARKEGEKLPFPEQYDLPFAKVQLKPERLDMPLRWRRPRRIFVNSVSDLFHEDVPDEFIARVYGAMVAAYWHTFQVLTKRPERRRELLTNFAFRADVSREAARHTNKMRGNDSAGRRMSFTATMNMAYFEEGAAVNIHEGTSVENRDAHWRVEQLQLTPARRLFLSCEPLLEDLYPGLSLDGISWVIVGGESGKGWRPMEHAWAQRIRDNCMAHNVAYFGKQDSGYRNEIPLPGELGDREFPE